MKRIVRRLSISEGNIMLYAVSPSQQEQEVTEFCFGSCGKIRLAGIVMPYLGGVFPCREENCQHEVAHTEVMGKAFDEDVCVRKLQPFLVK